MAVRRAMAISNKMALVPCGAIRHHPLPSIGLLMHLCNLILKGNLRYCDVTSTFKDLDAGSAQPVAVQGQSYVVREKSMSQVMETLST